MLPLAFGPDSVLGPKVAFLRRREKEGVSFFPELLFPREGCPGTGLPSIKREVKEGEREGSFVGAGES